MCVCVYVCVHESPDKINSQKINLPKREQFLFKQHAKRFTAKDLHILNT